MKIFIAAFIAVTTFVSAQAAFAQDQAREVAGRSYLQDGVNQFGNPIWWVVDEVTGERFQVIADVVTVKFAEGAERAQVNQLNAQLDTSELRRASTGWVDLQLPTGVDVLDVLSAYNNSDLVELAEATTIGTYTFIPNDAEYGSQYALAITQTENAWDRQTGDPSIVVAILDSGTDFTHVDLGTGADGFDNIWENAGEDAWTDPTDPSTGNGIDDDMNGFVDDWHGFNFDENHNDPRTTTSHGTNVGGVVAAKTNNAIGVAGAAGGNNSEGISMMIGAVGGGGPNGAVLDDAILYAAANGANVVQMSLSVGTSQAIDDAINSAYVNDGLLVVNAAGNGGQGCSVGYPARHVNVMAISASTSADTAASFTCWGPEVELGAPGASIRTTTLNNGYTTTSGTSFSAPLTSGIAALVWSQYPSLTNEQLRMVLWNSADKVGGFNYNWDAGNPGHSIEFGYGRINTDAALDLAVTFADDIFADSLETPVPMP